MYAYTVCLPSGPINRESNHRASGLFVAYRFGAIWNMVFSFGRTARTASITWRTAARSFGYSMNSMPSSDTVGSSVLHDRQGMQKYSGRRTSKYDGGGTESFVRLDIRAPGVTHVPWTVVPLRPSSARTSLIRS